MNKKVVVVGSINLDLVAKVARMPIEGETLTGTDFATYPGGKGGNQAVAAARLGARVVMVGRLGEDHFAQQLRSGLEEAGVGIECVLNVQKPSGSAVILVTAQGGNSIVVIPGANHSLTPGELDKHIEELRGASVILSQLEIPMDTVEHLGELANQLCVPFILDPAPAQKLSRKMLNCVTWLTPNESETLSILEHLEHSMPRALEEDDAIASAAEFILSTGVRNVILKLGRRGIYLAGKDVPTTRIAPYRVMAVDTTAAGDAFNGGFAYGLTHGMSPVESAQFACAVAAISVTRSGAQPSMPSLVEVEALMASVPV